MVSLEHAQSGCTHRIFALVDEVEYLDDHRVLKKLRHVHLVHDIKTVLSLGGVEDRLAHELVEDENVVLLLKVLHD